MNKYLKKFKEFFIMIFKINFFGEVSAKPEATVTDKYHDVPKIYFPSDLDLEFRLKRDIKIGFAINVIRDDTTVHTIYRAKDIGVYTKEELFPLIEMLREYDVSITSPKELRDFIDKIFSFYYENYFGEIEGDIKNPEFHLNRFINSI